MRVEIGDGVRLFVDVDGLRLVPDGPAMVERSTLLYLHGGPGLDHSLYKTPERNPLTDVAQLVFYDHRGNGRSDWRTPDEWNLDTWADDVVRLCDALGIEHPIVVGESFGGFVAQRYIARHPEHPAKVVLACTGARLDLEVIETSFTRFGDERAGAAARRFFGGDASAFGDFLEHCLPLYSTDPPDPDAMVRTVMNLEVMNHFFAGEAQTMDLRAGLAAARCPVLVLGGELDPVLPIELNQEVAACLPVGLARFEAIPSVSHLQVVPTATASGLLRHFVRGA
jgi:pimeloyl-ACP methyl ester carboxylesterase